MNRCDRTRTNAHNLKTPAFGRVHDIILVYTNSKDSTWNTIFESYSKEQLSRFKQDEDGRWYKAENLTMSTVNPARQFEWRGTKPPSNRSWGYNLEKLEKLWNAGMILAKKDGSPRQDGLKVYLDDLPGKSLNDVWIDIPRIGNTSNERLGYPTQKPEALLERIITTSSNEGHLVADFFCGCGTTIAAAQGLKRNWLGVDISHLAVRLIAKRLGEGFGVRINKNFEIHGFPKDIASAKELANEVKGGRLEFEEWIVEVLLHGVLNERRNEQGFDGYLTLDVQGQKNIGLIEVKSGNANTSQVNHFIKTVEKLNGNFGLFVCFEDQVTKGMREAAKREGYFNEEIFGRQYDKIQIVTVDYLIEGNIPRLPESRKTTYKKAERKIISDSEQGKLEL